MYWLLHIPKGVIGVGIYKGMERAAAELKNFGIRSFTCGSTSTTEVPSTALRCRHLESGCSAVLVATHFLPQVVELSGRLDSEQIPYIISIGYRRLRQPCLFRRGFFRERSDSGQATADRDDVPDRVFIAHIKFSRKDISLQMKTRGEGLRDSLRMRVTPVLSITSNLTRRPHGSAKIMHNYLKASPGKRAGGIVLNPAYTS